MNTDLDTLIFDLDGTIIDSRMDLVEAVNHVLETLGHPRQTMKQVLPKIGNGLRRLLMDTINLTDPVELQKAKDIFTVFYNDHCVDHTKPYPGVKEGLQEYSQTHKLAIVTNKPKPFADKILHQLELASYVPFVFGGDSLPQAKPDPGPLYEAIRVLGSDRSRSIMVGDGIQDLQAGQAAGIKTCLARYGFGFRPELLNLKPDHVIDSFEELKGIVT